VRRSWSALKSAAMRFARSERECHGRQGQSSSQEGGATTGHASVHGNAGRVRTRITGVGAYQSAQAANYLLGRPQRLGSLQVHDGSGVVLLIHPAAHAHVTQAIRANVRHTNGNENPTTQHKGGLGVTHSMNFPMLNTSV